MKQRCTNPNNEKYEAYGARGISVCARWMESYEAFRSDMGPRPRGYSIDRIDPDGDYEPSNCRWASDKTQHANRRTTIWVDYDGERVTASEFADRVDVSSKRLYKVMSSRGLDPHAAAAYVKTHRRR